LALPPLQNPRQEERLTNSLVSIIVDHFVTVLRGFAAHLLWHDQREELRLRLQVTGMAHEHLGKLALLAEGGVETDDGHRGQRLHVEPILL
jgi:hypothetical protein